MEKNTKSIKLFLVLALVGIFLMGSVAAFGDREKVYQTSNSYNHFSQTHNSYNNYGMNNRVSTPTRTSYIISWNDRPSYSCDGIHCSYGKPTVVNYKQHATQKTKEDFVETYIKEYSVSVTNKERTGRYYTVQFNFIDKNGYKFTQSMTQYLKDGERKKFDYKDIQFERHKITDWGYKIIEEDY